MSGFRKGWNTAKVMSSARTRQDSLRAHRAPSQHFFSASAALPLVTSFITLIATALRPAAVRAYVFEKLKQGKLSMATFVRILAAAFALHSLSTFAAKGVEDPRTMEPITLPENGSEPIMISKPTAIRLKSGAVLRYMPGPPPSIADTNTPTYFYPYSCTTAPCWDTGIGAGSHISVALDAVGTNLYLDGTTPSYSINFAVTNVGQVLSTSFYLNQPNCPGYLQPGGVGSPSTCFTGTGTLGVTWWYPFGPAGAWTYTASTNAATINQVAFTVDPLAMAKISGDGLIVAVGTNTGPRIVVEMRNADGTPVMFENLTKTLAPTATVKIGKTTTSVPSQNIQYKGSGQFSINAPIGSTAGVYTVTVSHQQATTPATFTVTAQANVPPPDNPTYEQGNGDGSSDFDTSSQTDQADKFLTKSAPSCGAPEMVADPINVTSGNTVRMEVDYARTGLSPLEFTRTYNSLGTKSLLMKNYWSTPFDCTVYLPAGSGQPARVRRPDGQIVRFNPVGTSYVPDSSFHGTLTKNGTAWRFVDTNQTIEDYDSTGKLTAVTDLQGRILTLTYTTGGLLNKVTANTGESLTFQYNSNNQISTVTDQAQRAWTYTYDAYNNLTMVKYPEGKNVQYLYADPNNPYLLSAVAVNPPVGGPTLTNAEQVWQYDSQGRAITNYVPDASTPAGSHRTDISFGSDGTTRALMDGNGNASTYTTQMINGRGFVNATAGPGVSQCGNDLSRTFDSKMNVASQTQFNHTTLFNNYDTKGQYAARIDASGTAQQRETDFLYDIRYFNKPTQITEPSVVAGSTKVTTLTYDNFGNVTQKTVSGYRPSPISTQPATAITRTWNYQYNGPYHQLSQISGPRTDVTQTTKFAYNAAGRLFSVTDANGILARNNIAYTATGNVQSEDRPNGLHLAYAYYAGSDLLHTFTETQGSATRTTTWIYDNDHRVMQILYTDGVNPTLSIQFGYNAAGTLQSVSASTGVVQYTFDAQGNPTGEKYSNSGMVAKTLQRTFDSYNRVRKLIGANNTIETDYFPDGTLTQSLDGKSQATQRHYDGLLRLTAVVRPDNSQISYAYDAASNLTQIIDPNNATTTYAYDDFGNKVSQISPDTGTTSYSYDRAGNLIQVFDAKQQTTSYTYDPGNRLLTVTRASTDYNETYVYDACTNGAGFLCSVTSGNGEKVAYQYNGFGEVAAMTTGNKTIAYQYNAQGKVSQITYPSGRIVNFTLNELGDPTLVTVTENGTTTTLAHDIKYAPLGPVTMWTYGNGLLHTRQYDQQYWVRSIATPNTSTLSYSQYDLNGNLTQLSLDGTSDAFAYDNFDELQSGSGDFGSGSYLYDAVGNRTSMTANAATIAYTYTPNSNRIATQTGWTYTLDANGNTTRKQAADGSGFQYTYSPHNRLIGVYNLQAPTVPVANYVYNALGQRAYKIVNGTTTRYFYGLDGKLLAEADASGNIVQEYVYMNGAPLALLGAPLPPPTTAYDHSIDTTAVYTSAWTSKSDAVAWGGAYYYLSMTKSQPETYASWNFTLPSAGYYDLYVWWIGSGETSTVYNVLSTSGFTYVPITSAAQTKGTWVKLGNFHFAGGLQVPLELDSAQNAVSSKGYLTADAARMVLTKADGPVNPNYLYVHTDHLGAPRALTNESGAVAWKAIYDPFGKATVNSTTATLNLRFPGQYFDAETGLHYNYFRDYDPTAGRYLESDPLGLFGGFNTFSYAGDDPMKAIDPFGLDWVYHQSTGQMTHVDANGHSTDVGTGYAGHGTGVNNPDMQEVQNTGPLPRGNYTIGPQQDHGRLRSSMMLTPDSTNEMHGRSSFLIHGAHANDRQDSSEGCIIMSNEVRSQIANSGDDVLQVVR
jgi:RHS repeat-associated protein